MSSWYHTVAGRYNVTDKWIGLDYSQLLGDPKIADSVMAHEMAHTAMAQETDFGQATYTIFYCQEDFKHLSENETAKMCNALINSQDFVQEGLATLFQVARLGNLTSKNFAIDWANSVLPREYKDKLERLKFAIDLSQRYRDYFTQKISFLALETGIRVDTRKLDLLSKPDELKKYLEDDDKNPNRRLEKIIEVIRNKSWIVTKTIPEIANLCGIAYFDPTTKDEVADFLNYVTGLTNHPKTFTSRDIGETPKGAETFIQAGKTMIIGNMNLNFTNSSQALFKLDDFLHYSDVMEIIFVAPNGVTKHRETIKAISGEEPEIDIAGMLKTGEKYITSTSKKKAAEILNGELKSITLFVKWGGYDIDKDQLIWSSVARRPDLVVYNNPEQMLAVLDHEIKSSKDVKFEHLYMGAMEDHPMQTLIVIIKDKSSIHAVNAWGNKGIIEILNLIRDRSEVINNEELRKNKKHLNTLFSFWMGMHWDIDWVETMLDGSMLIFRKDS